MEDIDVGLPSIEETIAKIQAEATRKSSEQETAEREALQMLGPEATASGATESSSAVSDVPAAPAAATEPPVEGSQSAAPQAEVVSPRLRRLLEKEAALIEREKRIAELESANATQGTDNLSLMELQRLYKSNRIEALKRLDPNFQPGKLAKQLWYHDLGDLAPKEARAELDADQAMGSVQVLRSELEETKQQILAEMEQRQGQLAYQQYVGATHAYAQAIPDELPLVKKFASKKPDRVAQALVGVAQKYAQQTGGQVLTPAEAAQRLEQSLKELQFGDSPGPVSTQATPAPQTTAAAGPPNTLRNKHSAVQPSRVTDESLDDEVLQQRAMAALEAAKRAAAQRGY